MRESGCKISTGDGPCGEPATHFFAASWPIEWDGIDITPKARAQLEEQLGHIPVCDWHWEETGLASASLYAPQED